MKNSTFKIGFSEIGGIFIGKDIQSDFSKHYAITVLISFGEAFKIITEDLKSDFFQVAIIQKNVNYRLQSSKKEYMAFIHIVPYSEIGIKLSDSNRLIQKLEFDLFANAVKEIQNWFEASCHDPNTIVRLLQLISEIPDTENDNVVIDERIKKSFDIIMKSDTEKLPVAKIASEVHLSISHFNRLFRKETGMSFRKFVLHSKLIKSIYAIYEKKNLTQASFLGGFSDQAHLTRTFKKNFGIKPSESLK